MEIQALDENGNLIGTSGAVHHGHTGATYLNTGHRNDNGQLIYAAIYPLTAFVAPGEPIYGMRLRHSGSPASGGDGGDGKLFIVYDPTTLVRPPTLSLTTSYVQPICPTNEGSITIEAVDNGGGAMEYSINGASGPWQSSNLFENIAPGDYTLAVRYQNYIDCINVSPTQITLGSNPNCSSPADYCTTGCNDNAYLNTANPNTIEYDNIKSLFHSTILKQSDGEIQA